MVISKSTKNLIAFVLLSGFIGLFVGQQFYPKVVTEEIPTEKETVKYVEQSVEVKIDYPQTSDVSGYNSLACESLLSASIIGSPVEYLTNGIEGTVTKGNDNIAITIIDQNTLSFITGSAIDAGVSEPEHFTILVNTDKELMAMLYRQISSQTNIFILNKKNGLAIWSKTKSEFLGYDSPSGDIIYLACR